MDILQLLQYFQSHSQLILGGEIGDSYIKVCSVMEENKIHMWCDSNICSWWGLKIAQLSPYNSTCWLMPWRTARLVFLDILSRSITLCNWLQSVRGERSRAPYPPSSERRISKLWWCSFEPCCQLHSVPTDHLLHSFCSLGTWCSTYKSVGKSAHKTVMICEHLAKIEIPDQGHVKVSLKQI